MIPIASVGQFGLSLEHFTLLAVDVGGTKTSLAIFRCAGKTCSKSHFEIFPSGQYDSLENLLKTFLAGKPKPDKVCIGVAGPVMGNQVYITNLGWDVDGNHLQTLLSAQSVKLLNDLEATAFGLAALGDEDLYTLQEAEPNPVGNAAIIAPGTGLGEAGLYWDGQHFHPFATEGGHCDFSPRTTLDIELLQYLQSKFQHVSWERILSGPGLVNIFSFLSQVKGHPVMPSLAAELENKNLPQLIHKAAAAGDATCLETIHLFTRYLAMESANLVVKLKATGGLFIGGGIIPKLLDQLPKELFLQHFLDIGRLQPLLRKVPVKIILNEKAALLGSAYYGSTGNYTLDRF